MPFRKRRDRFGANKNYRRGTRSLADGPPRPLYRTGPEAGVKIDKNPAEYPACQPAYGWFSVGSPPALVQAAMSTAGLV